MKPLEQLLRPNILKLKPYSSARDEYQGHDGIFLDANENPFNTPYNRYPDPHHRKLKALIGKIKKIKESSIFLGNGSDEAIDLLFRAFCQPGIDNVISIDPTYGMYQVAAETNEVTVQKVLLSNNFKLNPESILEVINKHTKIIWLCSPNNPTGNCFEKKDLIKILDSFDGIVVIDEAYIDFAPGKSMLTQLNEYPNLVILQTFSKAWGMAGLRLGMAFAQPSIISILNRIKYPYNLNILTQQTAIDLLKKNEALTQEWVSLLIKEREKMVNNLGSLSFVEHIYPSDANFLLVKTSDAKKIYNHLVKNKIIIRDRSTVALCSGCLRITIGSPKENQELIEKLEKL